MILLNGNVIDIVYVYNKEKYVVFDYIRFDVDINYKVFEYLKNGILFVLKY